MDSAGRGHPTRSEDYQEGETLAYLIDVLDDDGVTPVFRIYYQDAPTNDTIGQVPKALTDKKPIVLQSVVREDHAG
jgi:hypothetical protein